MSAEEQLPTIAPKRGFQRDRYRTPGHRLRSWINPRSGPDLALMILEMVIVFVAFDVGSQVFANGSPPVIAVVIGAVGAVFAGLVFFDYFDLSYKRKRRGREDRSTR